MIESRRLTANLLAVAQAVWLMSCSSSIGPVIGVEQAPLQTDSLRYELRPDHVGLRADIPYVYTNPTGMPVSLPNCHGAFFVALERRENGRWETAWSPEIQLCLSAPIVIPANGQFVDT